MPDDEQRLEDVEITDTYASTTKQLQDEFSDIKREETYKHKMHETEARSWNPPLSQATQGERGQKMYIVFLADLKRPI